MFKVTDGQGTKQIVNVWTMPQAVRKVVNYYSNLSGYSLEAVEGAAGKIYLYRREVKKFFVFRIKRLKYIGSVIITIS